MRPSLTKLERERAAGREYFDRCRRMRENGKMPVVINVAKHPSYWASWLTWFKDHDCRVQLELMRDGRREMTVPCLSPIELV